MKRYGGMLILDHCLLSLVSYVASYVKLSRYVQGRDWCNYEAATLLSSL